MRHDISKFFVAGISVVLAIAAIGCRHMAGKGASCCGPGAMCGPSKTAAPAASQPQGSSVHP